MTTNITIRGIEANKHKINKYVITSIFFQKINKDKQTIKACIRKKIHLIKDLKVNVLIDIDIFISKKFVLNFQKNQVLIENCSVTIFIMFKKRFNSRIIDQAVNFKNNITIFSHFQLKAKIHHFNLSFERNFFFEPDNINFDFYAHIIDFVTSVVLIRNDENKFIHVFRNFRLRHVIEMKYSNAYQIEKKTSNLTIKKFKSVHRKAYFEKLLRACMNKITKKTNLETSFIVWTKKSITIYDVNQWMINQLKNLIKEFFVIWTDQRFVIISKQKWMRISMKKSFEHELVKSKIYFFGTRDRDFINKTFDELHSQERLQWTKRNIFWNYSCFVIWKSDLDDMKNRVMIDVRRFNVLIVSDVYLLPLQSDIISTIKKCLFIFVIDCARFFYQWRVHFSNRHKFTVISHRDQKLFNVAIMKYQNFSFYVQRQIDRILRSCRVFVKIYIDDVIIFFKTKEQHLKHLKKIFQIFRTFNIFIKSSKTFLVYLFVRFLKQKVDFLKLITDEKKLRAINKLKFSVTLKQLKHYLDVTNWLRKYVKNYAKLIESLQIKKIHLLKNSLLKEFARRFFFSKS